ncbi:autotransporter outer membrane beta-barrel domain-containing protein [Phascolarctobacterium sp.]
MLKKDLARAVALNLRATALSGGVARGLLAASFICAGCFGVMPMAASAAVYTPGLITDTDAAVLVWGQHLFEEGEYTISNANNNTLNVTVGDTGLIRINNGEKLVVNGNLNIHQQGLSSIYTFGQQVEKGGEMVINGDFYWLNDISSHVNGALRENFNVAGRADFNGSVTMIDDNDSIPSPSQTTFQAIDGGLINVAGDAYIYNRVGNYITSGANAVYVKNGGIINFNGNTTRIMAVSNEPDAISAKNDTSHALSKTQVNINSKTTQILGSIDLAGFGSVNAVLSGKDSYWYGDEKNAGYSIFPTTGTLNITVKDGAEWGYFGDSSHYSQGKGVTALTLESGGIVNLYDDYLKQEWHNYGLDSVYSTISNVKHDYVYIGNLKGQDGIFQLDLNSSDKSQSDMIYIKNATAGTGEHSIQAYATDDFSAISADNTLRFATVGAGAANKITFKDSENIYGKSLWDYELLIGSEDYDVSDPENAVYNDKAAANAEVNSILGNGAKNWFIYGYQRSQTVNAQSLIAVNDALYATWINGNNTLRNRLGELDYHTDKHGMWARVYGGQLKGDSFKSSYHTYQIGYDAAFADKDGKQSGVWYGGAALEYSKGNASYTAGNGDMDMGAVALYATKKGKYGDNVDIVLKHGKLKGDIDTYGRITDSGDFDTRATSLSFEYNKRLTQKDGFFIEPQAQFTVGHIDSTEYTTKNGTRIKYNGMDSAIARLGLAMGRDFEQGNVYLKASALHELGGRGEVNMLASDGSSLSESKDYGDTWFELGLGTNWRTGKNNSVYLDIERSFGADIQKQWQINAGVQFQF